jgi:hypothetical protein
LKSPKTAKKRQKNGALPFKSVKTGKKRAKNGALPPTQLTVIQIEPKVGALPPTFSLKRLSDNQKRSIAVHIDRFLYNRHQFVHICQSYFCGLIHKNK